ncbi:MAG: hypothetical protein WBX15_20620 [Thermoanaerobaculia bacterium]
MMDRILRFFVQILLALWLGGGIFLAAFAAPAAFRVAPTPSVAGDFVGVMLVAWSLISLLVPLVLIVIEWARNRLGSGFRIIVLAFTIGLATAQAVVDYRVQEIRRSSPVAIENLGPKDPVRENFGRMHGVAMLLMLLQLLAAAGVATSLSEFRWRETRG